MSLIRANCVQFMCLILFVAVQASLARGSMAQVDTSQPISTKSNSTSASSLNTYYIQPKMMQIPEGPPKLEYEEGKPIPQGYRLQDKSFNWMTLTGAIMLGSIYFPTALIGSVALTDPKSAKHAWPLIVPVIGPFIAIKTINDSSAAVTVPLLVDGILQTTGAILLALGISSSKKILVRNDIAHIKVTVVPMVASKVQGLGVIGEF